MTGSVGRLFPKALLFWRARVQEFTNKLGELYSIYKTALFFSPQVNIKFVNFSSAVALKNLSFTDQRDPFQYQTLVQNFLYHSTRDLKSSLYESAVFSKYQKLLIRPSDKITTNVVQDSMLRWPNFSVISKVSGATSASHQRIKPIYFIASALKSGSFLHVNPELVEVPKLRWQARKGECAQFAAAGHITTWRMYSANLRALEKNKLLFAQPLRFTSKSHPLRTLVSEDESENLFCANPILLNWRQPKYSRNGLQQAEILRSEQSSGENVNFAVPLERAINSSSFPEKSFNQASEAIVKQLWSESTLARLADDVMRRIDKRLRIERERRGLQ